MTTKELQLFNELQQAIRGLQENNNRLSSALVERIEKVETCLSKKNDPIYLENDIVQSAKQAIGKAISDSLNAYNSPLSKLCASVIWSHEEELKHIVETSIVSVFKDKKFAECLNEELAHKTARILVDSSKGVCDSIIDELKKDNIFRAKLTIVISDMVKEYRSNVQTS